MSTPAFTALYSRQIRYFRPPSEMAVHPSCVDQYLRSSAGSGPVPGQATYFITNSSLPHETRRESHYTCLWEVAWEGEGTGGHFAFWSPSNAPASAVAYATVIHTLFEVVAQALGLRSKRVYRVLSIAMPMAP